jgi:hypothetical protein
MSVGTNARPWPGTRLLLANDVDLLVEPEAPFISVSSPGGGFRVTYKKPSESSQLVLQSEWWSKSSLRNLVRLRARAWRLANETAAQLGWFPED